MTAGFPGANATARPRRRSARRRSASGGRWRWRRRGPARPFDAEGEKTIRAALELLKPYMRA